MFRVQAFTDSPLVLRPWHSLYWFFTYFFSGLFLLLVAFLGLVGKAAAARQALVFTILLGASMNFFPRVAEGVLLVTSADVAISQVLLGLRHNLELDSSSNVFSRIDPLGYSLGLQASYLLVAIGIAQGLALFCMSWAVWRERSLLFWMLMGFIFMLACDLILRCINENLGSTSKLSFAICGCCFCASQLLMNLIVRRRILILIGEDKAWYDAWWSSFWGQSYSNRHVLQQLRYDVSTVHVSIQNAPHTPAAAPQAAATGARAGATAGQGAAAAVGGSRVQFAADLAPDDDGLARSVTRAVLSSIGIRSRNHRSRQDGVEEANTFRMGVVSGDAQLGEAFEVNDVLREREMKGPLPRVRQRFLPLQVQGLPLLRTRTEQHSRVCECFSWAGWDGGSSADKTGDLKLMASIDTLYQQAACLRPVLQRKMDRYVSETRGVTRGWGASPMRLGEGEAGDMALKEPERAVQKTWRCYGGDTSFLVDICRDALVFETIDQLRATLMAIHHDPEITILRIKNRLDPDYDSALSAGYRDVMINVRIENAQTLSLNVHHHVAEVQLIPQPVYDRRVSGAYGGSKGHVNYVLWRDLRGQ